MTIRHLKVFIEVVDEGGISKAAQKLFTSQPSVSQTILELENYYGIKLFERLNRKLFLTSEGEKLLGYARHICAGFNEMELNIGKIRNSGVLKIGATVTIGTCLLPTLLTQFASAEVLVDNTFAIEQLILLNKIDIGLVEGLITSPDIVTLPFYVDEMVFVAKNGSYNTDVFILREKGSGTREIAEHELKLLQPTRKNIWTMCNTESIKNAVKMGLGATAMSKLLLKEELAKNELITLKLKRPIYRNFVIAYHKNKFQTPPLQKFIELVLEKSKP